MGFEQLTSKNVSERQDVKKNPAKNILSQFIHQLPTRDHSEEIKPSITNKSREGKRRKRATFIQSNALNT